MYLEFGTWFYLSMGLSIVIALLLEAWSPLDRPSNDFTHIARNLSIWCLSFFLADYVVGTWWLDLPSFLMQQPFGLFYWYPLPHDWMTIGAGVIIMDLAFYTFHRLSHRVGFLWRFHSVHHSDPALDVSTTLRAHPVEMVLGNFWRIAVALAFGLPLWIIAFREVLIFPLVFLEHASVRMPAWFEKYAGKIIVTPAIHRVHHSIEREEHDSNYGDSLLIWDQVFGTFTPPVSDRPAHYGVAYLDDARDQRIDGMLMTPFRPVQR